jgi:hypothetical protein
VQVHHFPAIDNWLVIFDEFVAWFSGLALALKQRFVHPKGGASLHLSVMTVLTTKFAADLCAIRTLILQGFEVQARIVARSAIEVVELLLLVPHDPEMERAFFEANDFEKCNQFWHRYISKGRLRARVNKMTDEMFRVEAGLWKELRTEHEESHSILAHPSTIMGLLAMFPDEEGEDRPGHWGYCTSASVMTMRYLCLLCSNVILFNDFLPFRANGHYPALLAPDRKNSNHESVMCGREVITDATGFALRHLRTTMLDPLAGPDDQPLPER